MGELRKVLCVDDEPINLLILKKILGKKYDIITAKEGQAALDLMQKDSEIEMVISDMRMPGMSGLEFIHKASKRFSNKKYFMLSGFAVTDEIQEAIDAKLILRYFQKPANFKQLDQALGEEYG